MRIERPLERPRHHVVAFGAVLAAHVLIHDDVAGGHSGVVHLRYRRRQMRAVEAHDTLGASYGVRVNSMGAPLAPFGTRMKVLQLHAIAHGDHLLALDVVEAVGVGLEAIRRYRSAGMTRRCVGAADSGTRPAENAGMQPHCGREQARQLTSPRSDMLGSLQII